jgi:hypothetical protein
MRFTRIALAISFNLVIGFIVVPVSQQVNHKSKTNHTQQLPLADGMPLPPLPPPPNAVGTTLLADGMPLPPLPPNVNGTVALA